jgi:hypothetical protein
MHSREFYLLQLTQNSLLQLQRASSRMSCSAAGVFITRLAALHLGLHEPRATGRDEQHGPSTPEGAQLLLKFGFSCLDEHKPYFSLTL